jgi:hypothetical protein
VILKICPLGIENHIILICNSKKPQLAFSEDGNKLMKSLESFPIRNRQSISKFVVVMELAKQHLFNKLAGCVSKEEYRVPRPYTNPVRS